MKRIVITYFATLLIFCACDAVWLGVIAADTYKQTLGDTLLPGFRPLPALAFYLLNIVGLMVFAVPHGAAAGKWPRALLFGALFGLFSYATYDLTNYATLKVWTLQLTLTDMAWGTFVSGVATALGVLVAKATLRRSGPEK